MRAAFIGKAEWGVYFTGTACGSSRASLEPSQPSPCSSSAVETTRAPVEGHPFCPADNLIWPTTLIATTTVLSKQVKQNCATQAAGSLRKFLSMYCPILLYVTRSEGVVSELAEIRRAEVFAPSASGTNNKLMRASMPTRKQQPKRLALQELLRPSPRYRNLSIRV